MYRPNSAKLKKMSFKTRCPITGHNKKGNVVYVHMW